jgi:ABC-2 type transport system permease protein
VNLLYSEWIKLWSTRTTWTMIGIGLLIEGLYAGLYVGLVSLEEITTVEQIVTGTGLLLTLMLVLGVLVTTSEFRHGTASSTFFASPKRYPVLLAKLGLALGAGILVGLAFVIVNGGLALPLLSHREGSLPPTDELAGFYAGVAASMALICALGVGVGTIVRSQVGAIVAALALVFILSPLPELLSGHLGHYFPAQAIASLQGSHRSDGKGLSQISGGLVLAGWVAALMAVGAVLTSRRDVSE